jgi:menaquinone reductase, iron-sulfur cluster-binding subunit
MKRKPVTYGMVIDLDRCNGCGTCATACAIENNVAPSHKRVNDRTDIKSIRIYKAAPGVFVPIPCQQCGESAPCVSVCPQQAVEVDADSGIVYQMPQRCLGCRYCMAACPYHARYFNWWDPEWPAGMERTLNPDVAPRMRGVVEKCNFCHARLQGAKSKAAAAGARDIDPADYVPACAEACPSGAITFGDVAELNTAGTVRLLERIGTEPKVWYRTRREAARLALEEKHG